MSHGSSRARLLRALPLALLGAALVAPPAIAADPPKAPTRAIALAPSGRITENAETFAISADGREVLMYQFDEASATATTLKQPRIVSRDLVTGKTTAIGDNYEWPVGASEDLNRIAFMTQRALSPDDKNKAFDLYVHDRKAKTTALVSRAKTGGPALGGYGSEFGPGNISGDGTSVLFSIGPTTFAPDPVKSTLVRYDVATGQITTIAANASAPLFSPVDRAGKVAITNEGIFVGTRKLNIPANLTKRADFGFQVTPDGKSVFAVDYNDTTSAIAHVRIDTATGAVTKLPDPTGITPAGFAKFIAVNPAGTEALAEGYLGNDRIQLYKVTLATGASVPFGGTLPTAQRTFKSVVSAGWDFWANIDVVAQLGSKPIPGGVTAPTRPPATEYLQFDQGCKAVPSLGTQSRRPSLTLRGPGFPDAYYDFPAAVRADVRVTVTATGAISNLFSLTNGARHELNAGFGNFTVSATVTYADGFKNTLNIAVKAYTPPPCVPQPAS